MAILLFFLAYKARAKSYYSLLAQDGTAGLRGRMSALKYRRTPEVFEIGCFKGAKALVLAGMEASITHVGRPAWLGLLCSSYSTSDASAHCGHRPVPVVRQLATVKA